MDTKLRKTEEHQEKESDIENRKGITISDTHFISAEGSKYHNMSTYWAADKKGGHIQVVRYEGEYFLTQPTKSNYDKPIPYAISGRDDEQ